MSSFYISLIAVYIIVGPLFFWVLKGPIEQMIDDVAKDDQSETRMMAIVLAVIFICWPLITFGFGCGWGFTSWMKRNEAKVINKIMRMVERSSAEKLSSKEEWRAWFAEHINRMPRKFLYKMMVFDVSDLCELDKEEINKIISSEIADRDLFGNKR